MKSLTVDAAGKLEIREFPVPAYGRCQALVKLRSCGVCNGTDTKLIHRTFKNFDTYPAILGHEGVGEVVETGADVKNLKKGDLVLLPFLEQPVDGYTPGWGAYSEYAVVGDAGAYIENGMGPGTPQWSEGYLAQTVLRPDDKVDAVGAAMIITFREVLSAIRRFGFGPNESVLIFGAGPVGLCFTRFCKLLGMGAVITTDVFDDKVAEAKRMGADYAFNSRTCDVDAEVRSLFPDGVDNVVDAVGVNALLNQAMGLIKYNGKICGYGISPKLGMELDWSTAPYNWSLNFVQWPSKKEEGEAHAQIMAWINAGVLDPMDFISHTFRFEDVIDAFALVERREPGTKKIVIEF
ncbi:MAG: zinc-binding dehydrogenase [Subdoligranulum sp.]|nr:zinc-binding dehydrogenase [Subdoligranulum sp.]